MATYSVVAHDGQVYGPADENGIAEWIRQGRVGRQTVLLCHDTNARSEAWKVPALQPALGLSQDEVARLLQGLPTSGQPPVPELGYASAPMAYAQPIVHGPVAGLSVSSFPVAAAVLLSLFVPCFAIVYYGILHGDLPRRRPDDPGAGKAIGFAFIPFFNIFYWIPFFWLRLCTRINDERQRIGLPPTAPRGLVVAILWCFLGFIVPFVNILAMLAIFVMIILVLVQLQGSINGLADATRVS